MAIPSLTGCGGDDSPTLLTFGTYKDQEAVQLTSADFSTRFNSNENFLLAIYPKDSTCQCWNTFSYVIDDVVKNEHLLIYKFYAQDVSSNADMQEVGGFYDDLGAPSFYIIKNKKIAKSYKYSNVSFFKNKADFLKEIDSRTKRAKMYQVSTTQLDEKIASKESFSVFYARNKCSDCNYVIPNYLLPYYQDNYEKSDLYVLDLQDIKDKKDDTYQETKDHFLLSEKYNPSLGFNEGVVPTFQYYKEGILTDMSVYVNDGELTYSNDEACYYATSSYYNETRNGYHHYLDNVENKDLTKIKINESEVVKYENISFWDISYSSQYHNPLLKGFLDKYL